jgi:hypothetical protein
VPIFSFNIFFYFFEIFVVEIWYYLTIIWVGDIMGWLVFIAIVVVPLIFKMRSNYKANQAIGGIINALGKHSPEELADIVKWEEHLRYELAKHKVMLDRGELTDLEFMQISKVLLEKHREIERKYNISEAEMVEIYFNSRNAPSF